MEENNYLCTVMSVNKLLFQFLNLIVYENH